MVADEDLLVHVHIPKCAGTSLWYWLARHNVGSHGFLYPLVSDSFYYDEEALAKLGIASTALRCMSSHYFRVYPEFCAGRRMRYFTLLRDPVAHFVSYARYIRTVYPNITDQEQMESVPPGADTLSLREFTAWLLACEYDVPFRENYQTNYLTSYVWRSTTGRGPKPGEPRPKWNAADWEAYCSERLALGKALLRRFALVGTVERMPESLAVLVRQAASWGLQLGPTDDVGHVNQTVDNGFDVDWIREDDPIGRALLDSLAEDRALHAFASSLLDEMLESGSAA